tara:strand:+ start:704 stop:1408 length:705 start_codon:yes stop_codon:yes gene_type:complete
MNIFRRLFNIGKAEAHSVIDKLEDPIANTEQGIRDLKKDLDGSLKGLAEIKAIVIRSKREAKEAKLAAESWEKKAMLILQKVSKGELNAEDADRLAKEALVKKDQAVKNSSETQVRSDNYGAQEVKLSAQVQKLKSMISNYENELKTLKARVRVSETTKKMNKQLAGIDPDSTISMLERMKEKVEQDEALGEAYGEIAGENTSIEDEINDAANTDASSADDALAALKAKMNMDK